MTNHGDYFEDKEKDKLPSQQKKNDIFYRIAEASKKNTGLIRTVELMLWILTPLSGSEYFIARALLSLFILFLQIALEKYKQFKDDNQA